jgi:hypothetical protein
MLNYVRDFIHNWNESELPVGTRLGRTAKNLSKRLRGKDCCGHLGEPGC